jgi:hypothetical protein
MKAYRDWYTTAEVAALAGVKPATIHRSLSDKRAYAGIAPTKSHNGVLQWNKDAVITALKPKTYAHA